MSRNKIIILAVVILVAFGAAVYFITTQNAPATGGTQKSLLGTLFPFGNKGATPATGTPSGTTSGGSGDQTSGTPVPPKARRLAQISSKVVAGLTVLPPVSVGAIPQYNISDTTGAPTQAGSTPPTVRFVERGTGYVYDVNAKGEAGKKTSGTVIARTSQALFGDDGSTVLLRYIKNDNKTVATFLGHLVAPVTATDDGTLKGDFLPDNIEDIAVSPDQKNILFLLPTGAGIAGISMKTDGTAKKQLFSSSFSEWLLDWPTIGPMLTTKPSADVPGYVYEVTKAGVFQKIIGATNGLTTKTSPDGKNMLYSISGGNGLDLHIINLKDGTDKNTGLQTLPEKCLWGSDKLTVYCAASSTIAPAAYPDIWYQGGMNFTDAFWKIDAASGTTTEINDGEGNDLDATNLARDVAGQYLFFVNKIDGSLWALDLSPVLPVPAAPTLPQVQ